MSSIKQHYEWLHQNNPEKWGEFNGKLSAKDTDRSNCLTYFQRSIINKEESGGHIDLAVSNYHIVKLMVLYLGFTWEDIESNNRPDLPALTTVN